MDAGKKNCKRKRVSRRSNRRTKTAADQKSPSPEHQELAETAAPPALLFFRVRADPGAGVESLLQVVPARSYQETCYMSTTRAVLGPGFVVRELLFADEYSSMTVTAPWSPDVEHYVRDLVADGMLEPEVDSVKKLVELVEIEPASTDTSVLAERTVTVHLSSKHNVSPFVDCLRALESVVDGITSSKLIAKPPPPAFKIPVITQKLLKGCVSVTWAVGISRGTARLEFRNAGTANAFLQSFATGQLELPQGARVELTGFCGDDNLTAPEKEQAEKLKPKRPRLPPLRDFQINPRRRLSLRRFDEKKIGSMSAGDLMHHQYFAEIVSGLPWSGMKRSFFVRCVPTSVS